MKQTLLILIPIAVITIIISVVVKGTKQKTTHPVIKEEPAYSLVTHEHGVTTPSEKNNQPSETKNGIQTTEKEQIVPYIKGDPENKIKTKKKVRQFRKDRNLILADPTMGEDEKNEYIDNLKVAYFGYDSDTPDITDEDIAEQQRILKAATDLKANSEKAKEDLALTNEEKKEKIRLLVYKFLQTVDSPNSETE